jgi:hypothetical protein
MKTAIFTVILLAASACAFAASDTTANYPLKVHVTSTHLEVTGVAIRQHLSASIDGKNYFLVSSSTDPFVFRIGDYQGRITKDNPKGAAQYERVYELKFSDEKTEKYNVIGESE